MAEIAKPQKKKNKKSNPPAANDSAPDNLAKANPEETTYFNMLMPKGLKKEIKLFAMEHDTSMTDILIKSFHFFKANNS